MSDSIQAVQLTSRMQHMRDVMRNYWGDQYDERVVEWQSAITNVAEGTHVPPLQAAIQLAKAADGNAFAVIAAMAAFVEMVEPSADVKPQGAAA